MNAAAARSAVGDTVADAPVVIGAEIVAGHDGAAELLVRLRHGNGAIGSVTLDPQTGFDLIRAAGAASLDAPSLETLVGRPWLPLIKDL